MQAQRYRSMIAVILTVLWILASNVYMTEAAAMDVDTTPSSTETLSNEGNDNEEDPATDSSTTPPAEDGVISTDPVPDTDATEAAKGIITAITDSDGQPLESSYAVTVPAGESEALDELLWKLLRVQAIVEGETEAVTLYVDWDYNSLIAELDTPGEYTHTAAILADGYTFADGVLQSLTIVVTVTEAVEKEPAIIQSFDSLSNRYAYAVVAGSDWQEFWDTQFADYRWEQSWPCYTAEGESLYAHITWENPEPDMSRTGIVTVRGTAVLPENTVLAEGMELPIVEVPVSIQTEPTLDCWCADADVVYIPWVMGDLEYDNLQFLASVNDGEWIEAGEWMDTNGESVCVWIFYLEEGSTYQVKAAWDGGETNVFEFTWNGAVTDAGPVEGDRDGGDTGGNTGSDITQPGPGSDPESATEPDPTEESEPEPDPTTEPTEEPEPSSATEPESVGSVTNPETPVTPDEPFYEEVTDTYSLLSGTRLCMMRQTGAVRFSKQGITITLSDAALDAMALTDGSRFLIELERTAQGFVLTAELDGVPLTALPDTLVLCPVSPSADNSQFSLQNEQGGVVCEGAYDPETGIASFTIQAPGRYTIVESINVIQDEIPPAPETTETSPTVSETEDVAVSQMPAGEQEPIHFWLFLLVAVLSFVGLAIGLFFVRRWRR